MEQLGVRCRTEGVEAGAKPPFEFIRAHETETTHVRTPKR